MEFDLISNPLYLIFKLDSSGIVSEEIEDSSTFPLLYNYILENSNKTNKIQAINIIKILKEIIIRQRSICAYLPKYNNKSIYIFLFELFLKEKNIPQLRKELLELISEINTNIQISKEIYDFIFQQFSKLYRKDQNFLNNIKNMNYSNSEYFLSLLELLNSTLSKIDKEKLPSNYFSCFGNNSFNLSFNKEYLPLGIYCSFILNFKISKSKLMEKNPQDFGKCNLITVCFTDDKKVINIELKYPNNIYINDGKEELKAKTIVFGDWVTLLVTLSEKKGDISAYFGINGEDLNIKTPLKLKHIKLKKDDKIKSISFFDNFYGEVTSTIIICHKNNDSFNLFSNSLKYLSVMKKGLWEQRAFGGFVKFCQNLIYSDKKRDKGGGSIYDDLLAIFTPINYDPSRPKILEDCLNKYNFEINGNIRNHKYYPYQKYINQICTINNFLPIAEMFLIYQKEFLNEKNFVEFLVLISNIVCGKDNLKEMNKCNFFKLLGLIIEKLPNEYFNDKIFNGLENIGNNILKENINEFCSDFFVEILLNEKIIFKFNDNLRSSLWNIILQFYLTSKEIMRYTLDTKKLCNILLFCDEFMRKEMCCEFHLNMYKKEFIGNITSMKPELNYQLISLKKLINEHLLSQNDESIVSLIELLILDLSPCMLKIILEILINLFTTTNKNEEWKKSITLKIVKVKYITIFVNLFIHSLPDVRYEILTLMFYIYISLLRKNNGDKFSVFQKMIKTCLLPSNIFYEEKALNISKTNKKPMNNNNKVLNQKDNKKHNEKDSKNLNKNQKTNTKSDLNINNKEKQNNDKEKEKEKIIKADNNKENEEKKIKRNSVISLAEKFENKNKGNDKKAITNTNKSINTKKNPSKISDKVTKIFELKEANIKPNSTNQQNTDNKIQNENNREIISNPENNNKNEVTQENEKSENNLIITNEVYRAYLINIYNFLLEWSLGIQITYNSSTSTELFSKPNQTKDNNKPKNNLIMNMNILEILFKLINDLDEVEFTKKLLNDLEQLIELNENSYFVILNNKIYSSILEITFKYYKKTSDNGKESEIYQKGKKICTHIFINVLKYLKKQHKELPMKRLELILLWGNKNFNCSKNEEETYDFIRDLLLEILNLFKKEFKTDLKNDLEFNSDKFSQFKNDFCIKNYLVLFSYIYYFCIHYKLDQKIKNIDINSTLSSDSNINIPECFISGMRMNKSKGNDINESWKDFHLIENIFNEIDYIFQYSYIKKKIFNIKSEAKQKNKEKSKESDIKYDKYNKILNELILNSNKRNVFSKELYFLCFFESDDKTKFYIQPLIKMISISYICILSEIKNINNKTQFILWLNKYQNLLRFLFLSSINMNPNKNEIELYNIIQNSCFEIISSGLCFLYNLYETCTIFKEEIKRVINNLFLLCFSILKIFLNKNLFANNPDIYSFPNSILILFNDYIKDKNKLPFIDLTKIEEIYLNPNNKIFDLINKKEFVEVFFQNSNLKNKLAQGYYSIEVYKKIVNERFKLLINLEEKLDYSYQINIHKVFSEFERGRLTMYNNRHKIYIKNRKEYKKLKQSIFAFNGMWSNRNIFYGDINFGKIKYKIMNHYSNNLMRPLIKPIIDINYYLPDFPTFKKENLFLENNSKESNNSYDLILDFDKILKLSNFSNTENKTNNVIIDKNNTNTLIFREQYYKSDLKYYSFLEKISKMINSELTEDEINKDLLELKPIKEDNSKLNNHNTLKVNERKTTTLTASTRFSTIKNTKTFQGSQHTSFINLTLDKDNGVIQDEEEEIYTTDEYTMCCLVKITHHIKGCFYIKDKKISFKNILGKKVDDELEIELNEKDDNYDLERGDCYGSYFKRYEKDKNFYKLCINYDDIKLLLKRKYYYKNSSIEIFTSNHKSYFFNFNDENTKKTILDKILAKIGDYSTIINDMKEQNNKDNIIGYLNNKHISIFNKFESKKNIIKLSRLVKLWKSWEISNLEFLMLLNILSNRSYIDITQYPVFPWLITNYEDPLIKESLFDSLDNSNNDIIKDYSYRDLSIPMGMLTINEDCKKRSLNFTTTFKIIKEDEAINKPYYFGCNYSTPAYISNYLIRLFPFTQACIEIQGTGFDTPHRLFTSIIKTFKNATTQSGDVRELIPEFFYLPEMYLNLNKLNLGKFNDQTQVGDVDTPCGNNPYEFTTVMRNILESQNVSNAINGWIDLIFGIKARDEGAEMSKNVFRAESYQEDINLDEVEDKISYLKSTELGLIPNQLFNIKELDKRDKLDDIKKIKQITDTNCNLKFTKNKKISSFYSGQNNNLYLIGIKNISNDKFIFVYNNSLILEKKIWYSNKDCGEDITLKKQKNNINKISPDSADYIQNYKIVKIIRDGKLILIGGFYDGKISVIQNDADNKQFSIYAFKDESIVTIINTDLEEKYLFIGNDLGNISIMQIESNNVKDWKEIYFINDQLNSISSIEINYQLNVWASASIDGYINLYTLPTCKLINSFKLDTNNPCNNIFICDSPLPSILIICQEEIFLYSINGHKIHYQKEYSKIINPIVIKDFMKNDYLAFITNGKEISIRNISDFTLISNIEIDREIHYLFTNENNKVLYATNISGTEINAVFCENKK